MHLEIVNEAQATLGEGPAWDAKTGTLYWVDVQEKAHPFSSWGSRWIHPIGQDAWLSGAL
jgi:hypothetical protein